MKRIFAILLSFCILMSTLGTVTVIGANSDESIIDEIEISEEKKAELGNMLDRIVNYLIDIIHRIIVVCRYPWTATDNKIDLSKFELTFEDEFEGTKINTNVWKPVHQGIRKGGYWDFDQISVKDGNLHIRTEYKEDGKYGAGYYCGSVNSNTENGFEQTYGYFECRCILPAAQGLWSAFWLFSNNIDDYVPGEEGTEIDVFESPMWYRGNMGLENGLVTSNLHYGGYSLGHRYLNVTVGKANNPYEEYNTYGVEWNEDGYIFYVNGYETGRSSFGGVSKVPEFMKLSVEVDGAGGVPAHGWSGIITDNEDGAIPVDFVVDYVRAYQYK